MLTDFTKIVSTQAFLEASQNEADAWPMSSIEFNVPANLVMLVESSRASGKPMNPSSVESEAESGMLQIALLNLGMNPGSPFINSANLAGWRYRPHLGFYKEESHGN